MWYNQKLHCSDKFDYFDGENHGNKCQIYLRISNY